MSKDALVLGIDTETTSLSPKDGRIIEVGAVLWSTVEQKPLMILSETIETDTLIPEEITVITGLNQRDVSFPFAAPGFSVAARLSQMAKLASYFCAHNAIFDRGFIEPFLAEHETEWPKLPWICTSADIQYPKHFRGRNLTYLAAEHGFINPFPHRALSDAWACLKVLSNYDFETVAALAREPNLKLVAQTSFAEKDLAKEAGFRWQPETKEWVLFIKKPLYDPANYIFKILVAEEIPA